MGTAHSYVKSTKTSGQGIGGGRPKIWTQERIEGLADELLEWIQQPQNFWLTDFATEHLFWEQRMVDFADDSPKFREAYKIAKQIQTTKIMKGVLAGKFNPAMGIFALKNVSKWTDRVDLHSAPQKTVINVVHNHVPQIAAPAAGGNGNGNGNGKHAGDNGHAGSDAELHTEADPSADDA